ncbi:MAG: hypothetical protein AB9903_06525 [Vulcanimicrobiota bacterium]
MNILYIPEIGIGSRDAGSWDRKPGCRRLVTGAGMKGKGCRRLDAGELR